LALQESGEMYLESIYVLSKEKNCVRAIDVGEHLGYSKPSVSRAMGILRRDGYITVDKDGSIALTEMGKSVAETMFDRHTLLTHFLVSLGVDEKTATDDACKIEHVISARSFDAIRAHTEKYSKT
jgi:Mn-dependent DtxR family transcriptional regulator